MKRKETILEEAQKLVYGDRNKDYGHPLDDFSRTAAMATGMLSGVLKPGFKINPEHVGLFMILVKVSRQMNRPKRDNLVDIAGYAATVQMCLDETERRKTELFKRNRKMALQYKELMGLRRQFFYRTKKVNKAPKKERAASGRFVKKGKK